MGVRMNRRQRSILFASLALGVVAALMLSTHTCVAQAIAGVAQLTAGPTYTSTDGKASPRFPNIDLVFELKGPDGASIVPRLGDLRLFSQGQEIGTATSIRRFEQTGYGITSILALDASRSMKGAPPKAVHASIGKFVGQARSQDRVAVLTFADSTQIDVPFGSSQAALAKELQTVQARGKLTRLYDGLFDAMALYTIAQPRRRQLLVVSDGQDDGSVHSAIEVILKAKSIGVVVDSIGLTGKDGGDHLESLAQLSHETGGTFVRAQSAQDLEGLIGQGIEAMRATPVGAFRLTHMEGDDKVHAIELRWQAGRQNGQLAAPAFLRTPKLSLLHDLVPDRISDLWAWGLGGCFVAGVILLIISWRGARPKASSGSMQGQQYQPASVTPIAQAVPASAAPPAASAPYRHAVVRTPTLPEHALRPRAYEAVAGSKLEQGKIKQGKIEVAAFFSAPASGPFARLRISSTNRIAGQSIPVTATSFTIGAAASNNLVLPGDLTISSEHVLLLWENSILKIEDLNSTNGTYVNAKKIAQGRHLLKSGDEIRIGRTVMVVGRA